jgi:hypothetical protein
MPIEEVDIAVNDSDAYLTVEEAEAIALTIPASLLTSWASANEPQKAAAILAASDDLDHATPWQGRKYDLSGVQVREFPRYVGSVWVGGRTYEYFVPAADETIGINAGIWDWDSETDAAVVPNAVLKAVVYQANSILAGNREERMAARHDGITDQSVGPMSESYGEGEVNALCSRAWQLVKKYEAKTGELL